MVRYRMRSESDVEFSMLDLLFTAPANTHKVKSKVKFKADNRKGPLFFCLLSLTGAAAPRPDTCSPVLSVPVRPHGLNLIDRRRTTHAVEAFS